MNKYSFHRETVKPVQRGLDFAAVGRGWIVSAMLAVLMIVVVGLTSQFIVKDLDPSAQWLYWVIHGLAVLIGGAVAARQACSAGWVHGLLLGLLYTIILVVVGGLLDPAQIEIVRVLWRSAILVALGLVGGVLGVNL